MPRTGAAREGVVHRPVPRRALLSDHARAEGARTGVAARAAAGAAAARAAAAAARRCGGPLSEGRGRGRGWVGVCWDAWGRGRGRDTLNLLGIYIAEAGVK